MKKFTVFGHTGFIGSNIIKNLNGKRIKLILPKHGQIPTENLGTVIYAIGKTSGFTKYPIDTVNAHVCFLKEIFENGNFDDFLYLSSTRVYNNLSKTIVNEKTPVNVNIDDPSEIYNISKLMGESLCLSFKTKNIKVVRLSNVFGADMNEKNFFGDLLHQAIYSGQVVIKQTKDSGKDYISIEDVVPSLFDILEYGKYNLYNISSGENILHQEISTIFEKYGIKVKFTNSMKSLPPVISNERLCNEFSPPKVNLLKYLETVLKHELL